MNKITIVLVAGLLAVSVMGATEITVPIGSVDLLKANDAAKATAEKSTGIIGTAVGYVKGGIIYLYDSAVTGIKTTGSAIVEHPYVSISAIVAAIMADKNNNWTGLWKESDKGTTVTTTTMPASITADIVIIGSYNTVHQENE